MTAFEDAATAFPTMLASTAQERAAWLRSVADALDAAADELVALADEETHLGPTRLRGEVGRTTGQLRLFAAAIEEGSYLCLLYTSPSPRDGLLSRMPSSA